MLTTLCSVDKATNSGSPEGPSVAPIKPGACRGSLQAYSPGQASLHVLSFSKEDKGSQRAPTHFSEGNTEA